MPGGRRWCLQAFRGTPVRETETQQKARWILKINLTFHPNYRRMLCY